MKKIGSIIAIICIIVAFAGLFSDCSDTDVREYTSGMSVKEYQKFSQKAYEYNHKND